MFLEKGETHLIVGHISYSRGFQVAFVERICISMYPLFPQILCRFDNLGFLTQRYLIRVSIQKNLFFCAHRDDLVKESGIEYGKAFVLQ